MKVAIVHYWLVGMRGGEKVIEALCEMYPDADIFTHVYVPEKCSEIIRRRKVSTTFINRLPRAAAMYKAYLPLMPLALEQIDLSGYDLIISSESGPAKGVIAPADAPDPPQTGSRTERITASGRSAKRRQQGAASRRRVLGSGAGRRRAVEHRGHSLTQRPLARRL